MIDLNKKPEEYLKPCPECKGNGYVPSPYWIEWYGLVEKFQSQMDYGEAVKKADKAMNAKYGEAWADAPEDETCEACNGKGRILSRELEPLELILMIKEYRLEK